MKSSRKDFIKTASLLGVGTMLSLNKLQANTQDKDFTLPPLGYSYNALEPFIDALTMEIHYTKHHQAYLNKMNELKGKDNTWWSYEMSLEQMLGQLNNVNAEVRTAVRNNLGGHWNHSFFWKLLKKDTKPNAITLTIFEKNFGSLDGFKAEFKKTALGVFGSGWAWVIKSGDTLKICSTANQDNPLMDVTSVQGKPILGLDVWEHAYYLKYHNKRTDYIDAFFNVLNWEQVAQHLQ